MPRVKVSRADRNPWLAKMYLVLLFNYYQYLVLLCSYHQYLVLLFNYHQYLILLFNYHQYLVLLFNYHQHLVLLFNYHQYLVLLFNYHQYLVLLFVSKKGRNVTVQKVVVSFQKQKQSYFFSHFYEFSPPIYRFCD